MAVFLRSVAFHGIYIDQLFQPGNPVLRVVHSLVESGIRDGTVKPLQTTVFDKDDVEAAFRFMSQGKHIGKILIKVNGLPAVPTNSRVSKYVRKCSVIRWFIAFQYNCTNQYKCAKSNISFLCLMRIFVRMITRATLC